ncbi:hypothetical protein BDV93DRAFT_524273 [Ceratobasidium sp. AG-I]|nr:hypothetical protein BDV93DRAFT_524273 [Ceratobasidium sp. AG-I]
MSHVASSGSSPATIPPISEASWDNCQQSSGSAPVTEPKAMIGAFEQEDALSDTGEVYLEAESPTPSNKNFSLPDSSDKGKKVLGPLEDPLSALTICESKIDPDFCFNDSNITVQVEKRLFRIHEFKLKEFGNIKSLMETIQKDPEGRKTVELAGSADDFHNIFTILYSSTYDPQSFDATVLKSTLHLSAIYDHPKLRAFAIQKLEHLSLPPIERFALSRDCNIESWMSTALDDLCQRMEPLTLEEADVLGTKKFVELAARREQLKFECGSRLALAPSIPAPALTAPPTTKPLESAPTPPVVAPTSNTALSNPSSNTTVPAKPTGFFFPNPFGLNPAPPSTAPASTFPSRSASNTTLQSANDKKKGSGFTFGAK